MAAKTRKSTKKPLSPAQREAKRVDAKAKADALHATLATQVAALTSSDEWKRYLDTMSKFRTYSFRNTILIMIQRPNATLVRGYRQWEELGRQVKKGEGSIKIFGYSYRYATKEDENGKEQKVKVPFFPVLSVFDISQTEGEELPQVVRLLTGEDELGIYERTAAWLTGQGWAVERGDSGAANGYTDMVARKVVVGEHLEPAAAAKTMLHEAAHVILHHDKDDYAQHRGIYEVEAESTAYVAAGMLGLDTSDYSVGYVGGWAKGDVKVLEQTAGRVHQAVQVIVDLLDPEATGEAPEGSEAVLEKVAA